MNYKILPTRQFENDFKKLDFDRQLRVKEKIDEVSLDPTKYKHMKPPLQKYSRIRIGKLRILFDYNISENELYLRKIIFGHKY